MQWKREFITLWGVYNLNIRVQAGDFQMSYTYTKWTVNQTDVKFLFKTTHKYLCIDINVFYHLIFSDLLWYYIEVAGRLTDRRNATESIYRLQNKNNINLINSTTSCSTTSAMLKTVKNGKIYNCSCQVTSS